MSRILLLISGNSSDQPFAAQVAQVAGLELKHASTPAEGVAIIESQSVPVILADASSEALYQTLETALQERVGLFSDKISPNGFHFLTSSGLEHVPYLVNSPLFGHLVMRNWQDPVAAANHYGRVVRATLLERAFGLKALLGNQVKIQNVKLQVSTQKQGAVEAVRNYLLAAKFQARMASVVSNAVDELLMNAIFDAPIDEIGRQAFASTPRSASFQLEGQHAVELEIGFDGQYVAVTAIDQFGSLDKVKLLTHISKIYTDEEYKVKTSVAGAGIGLATVYRSGGSFFFASEAQTRTEVTVFFRRTDSFREFKDQFRFISTQFYMD